MPVAPSNRRIGFTLVELLVVISIIGIIISLILVAAADGVRRAEERQTQTLITKLEVAVTDRFDALLASTPPINQTHRYLASLTYANTNTGFHDPVPNSDARRAQVIAVIDYLKSELPDVFFLNPAPYASSYPLNFAAAPYPLTNPNGLNDFVLPLGNYSPGLPYSPAAGVTSPAAGYNTPTPGFNPVLGYNNLNSGLVVAQNTGIFGASYTAAAGIYKNLYEAATLDLQTAEGAGHVVNTKAGYDATDNNNNGLVDDLAEITVTPSPTQAYSTYVAARLAKHTHNTARSEALYGLLVEGQGPLGSVFNRDDFTNREVGDTDGDGMLEFIDAWGQPIQFYRWPIYYGTRTALGSFSTAVSDSQKGADSYATTEARQVDPLDPNQLLVAPSWWPISATSGLNPGLPDMSNATYPDGTAASVPDFSTGLTVTGPAGNMIFAGSPASPQANAFMMYFKSIIDPGGNTWDRSPTNTTARRSYYSRFLVLSGGPDRVPGTFQMGFDYSQIDVPPGVTSGGNAGPFPAANFPQASSLSDIILISAYLNWVEGQAGQVDVVNTNASPTQHGRSGTFLQAITPTTNTSVLLQQVTGLDDITNQALSAPGAAAK